MRVFVDTNVLLDMICQREGFKEDADTIFRYCIEDKLKIVMSALTLINANYTACLLYTSPSPRDRQKSRMPSSA